MKKALLSSTLVFGAAWAQSIAPVIIPPKTLPAVELATAFEGTYVPSQCDSKFRTVTIEVVDLKPKVATYMIHFEDAVTKETVNDYPIGTVTYVVVGERSAEYTHNNFLSANSLKSSISILPLNGGDFQDVTETYTLDSAKKTLTFYQIVVGNRGPIGTPTLCVFKKKV